MSRLTIAIASVAGTLLAARIFRRKSTKKTPVTKPEDRRILMPGQHEVQVEEIVRLGTRLGTPWPIEATDAVVSSEYWNLAGEEHPADGKVITALMPIEKEVEARVTTPGTAKVRLSFPDGTRVGEWVLITNAPFTLGGPSYGDRRKP